MSTCTGEARAESIGREGGSPLGRRRGAFCLTRTLQKALGSESQACPTQASPCHLWCQDPRLLLRVETWKAVCSMSGRLCLTESYPVLALANLSPPATPGGGAASGTTAERPRESGSSVELGGPEPTFLSARTARVSPFHSPKPSNYQWPVPCKGRSCHIPERLPFFSCFPNIPQRPYKWSCCPRTGPRTTCHDADRVHLGAVPPTGHQPGPPRGQIKSALPPSASLEGTAPGMRATCSPAACSVGSPRAQTRWPVSRGTERGPLTALVNREAPSQQARGPRWAWARTACRPLGPRGGHRGAGGQEPVAVVSPLQVLSRCPPRLHQVNQHAGGRRSSETG